MLHKPAVALAVLVVATLALYHDTVVSLVRLWTDPEDPTYHHGLLLIAVCLFLFCRRWLEVRHFISVRPSLSASVLVLLASFAWLLGSLVSVLVVQQLSLALLLGLLVVSVVGYRSARLFAVPFALTVFALPIWEPINPYLERLTAVAVAFLVNSSGIPALLEGTQISIPAGSFDVEPSCSGLAQLIVGTTGGVIFAYINQLGRKTTFWTILAAAAISALVNIVRVYIVVIAGQLTGMQHPFVTNHYNLGWTLFAVAMFLFLFAASRLIGGTSSPSKTVGSVASADKVHALAQSAALALGALVLGPALAYAYQIDPSDVGGFALLPPAVIGCWQGAPTVPANYRPVFHDPAVDYERLYHCSSDSRPVYLYVAAYPRQEQGKEAVYYLNSVYDGGTWKAFQERMRYLGSGATAWETQIQSQSGAQKLVWQWYYVHGFTVGSDSLAKLYNAWGALRRDPAITVVVVATDTSGGYEETVAVLRRFVTDTRYTIESGIDNAQRY